SRTPACACPTVGCQAPRRPRSPSDPAGPRRCERLPPVRSSTPQPGSSPSLLRTGREDVLPDRPGSWRRQSPPSGAGPPGRSGGGLPPRLLPEIRLERRRRSLHWTRSVRPALTRARPRDPDPVSRGMPTPNPPPLRLLIVDDDDQLRQTLTRRFERQGLA